MDKKTLNWILMGGSIFGALGSWWNFWRFFSYKDLQWTFFILSFCILLTSLLFLAFLDKKYTLLATTISFIPAFFFALNFYFFLIFLLSLGMFFLGSARIIQNRKNSICIKISVSLLAGYSLITTAICLVFTSSYYFQMRQNKSLNHFSQFSLELPEKITNLLFSPLTKTIGKKINLNNPNETVDEYITESLKKEAKLSEIDFNLDLSEAGLEKSRKKLSSELEIEIQGQEKMATVFNHLINKEISLYFNNLNKDKGLSSISLTIALFFTLKTITWALRLPLTLIISAIFYFLTKFEFIELKIKNLPVEIL